MEFRLLTADEIDCRISTCSEKGVSILLYKDARCDMNILDETVGAERWQRHHELINGNLFCNVGINFPTPEGFERWVWKQDVGTESYTEKEKGEASDSFKRACFNWGIGRELYTAPFMWVNAKNLKTLKKGNNDKWTCSDVFRVTEIEYDNRKIAYVKILNAKTGEEISFGTPVAVKKTEEQVAKQTITEAKAKALISRCVSEHVSVSKLCEIYKVTAFYELTEVQHQNIHTHWDKVKEKCSLQESC